MTKKMILSGLVALSIAGAMAGCSASDNTEPAKTADQAGSVSESAAATEQMSAPASELASDSHSHMNHKMDGGPVPEEMVAAENPTYPVGSKVTLTADHMPGMDGAAATIVGAYKTYTYAVDYTPTDGGKPVNAHKWVVQEEIKGAGADRLKDGSSVELAADHMEGMQGAKATVAFSTDETVYVIDYVADGMEMKNHKWVVESEIQPAG